MKPTVTHTKQTFNAASVNCNELLGEHLPIIKRGVGGISIKERVKFLAFLSLHT